MSEELKPEPRIDKDGMPWCNDGCIHYHYHGLGATGSGHTCQISGEGMEVWEGCYPAIRKMVAELERLKVENKKQTISYCKVCGKVLQEGEYRLIPGRGHICYRCCPLITTLAAKEENK